jgi:hypothetical protein
MRCAAPAAIRPTARHTAAAHRPAQRRQLAVCSAVDDDDRAAQMKAMQDAMSNPAAAAQINAMQEAMQKPEVAQQMQEMSAVMANPKFMEKMASLRVRPAAASCRWEPPHLRPAPSPTPSHLPAPAN